MKIGFQQNIKPKPKDKKKTSFPFLRKKSKDVKNELIQNKEQDSIPSDIWQSPVNLDSEHLNKVCNMDSPENTNNDFFGLGDIDNSSGEQIALDLQMQSSTVREFADIEFEGLNDNFTSKSDSNLADEVMPDLLDDSLQKEENFLDNTLDDSLFDFVNNPEEDITEEVPTELVDNSSKDLIEENSLSESSVDLENSITEDVNSSEFDLNFSVIEELDNEILNDDSTEYAILSDVELEADKTEYTEPEFVRVTQDDSVMTDAEYETLLDLFSTLSKEEVEALPKNYKKIFEQNFKVNDVYLGEDENAIICKKLGLEHLDIRKTGNSDLHLTSKDLTATLGGTELPISVIQKLLPEGKTIEEPENLEKVKKKIKASFEPKYKEDTTQNNVSKDIGEVPLIAISYHNDAVPDAEMLQDGILGIHPYKVFSNGKLLKCNSNYEILLNKGDKVLIRTGIKYIATPQCKVVLTGPEESTGLALVDANVGANSIDLCLKATVNTYINKNSIVCKINYEGV